MYSSTPPVESSRFHSSLPSSLSSSMAEASHSLRVAAWGWVSRCHGAGPRGCVDAHIQHAAEEDLPTVGVPPSFRALRPREAIPQGQSETASPLDKPGDRRIVIVPALLFPGRLGAEQRQPRTRLGSADVDGVRTGEEQVGHVDGHGEGSSAEADCDTLIALLRMPRGVAVGRSGPPGDPGASTLSWPALVIAVSD